MRKRASLGVISSDHAGELRSLFVLAILTAGLVALSACAGVQVKRVTAKSNEPGIRYWRPEPYFALIETRANNAVTCDVKTFYLPDKSEEYAITISAGMGKANVTPQLENGWNLTSLSADIDSKASENITAIASLLKEAATLGTAKTAEKSASAKPLHCQGVYRVAYDTTGRFRSFERVSGLDFY